MRGCQKMEDFEVWGVSTPATASVSPDGASRGKRRAQVWKCREELSAPQGLHPCEVCGAGCTWGLWISGNRGKDSIGGGGREEK